MKIENIEIKVLEDIFSKDLIVNTFSRKFYGYLKSNNAKFYVNDEEVEISYHLKINDRYTIKYPIKEHSVIPSNKPIHIIYEDEYLIILDKEPNLLTIPSRNNFEDSLYNRLAYHKADCSLNIITRLDAKTSGLVLVTKKSYLVEKIKATKVGKTYLCKTSNKLPFNKGVINLPIDRVDNLKRGVVEGGKESITEYSLIENTNFVYKINLLTGRTHQIRVHLSHFNCPIDGDSLYGSNVSCDVMKLVCSNLKFIHPITGENLDVSSKYNLE